MSRKSLRLRFQQKLDKGPHPNGCWLWTGSLHKGYGRIKIGVDAPAHVHEHYNPRDTTQAIRVSWMLHHRRAVPAGHDIDHLCRTPACVRPAHLEAVTKFVNWERGESPTRLNQKKTHCLRGHELSGDNLQTFRGDNGLPQRKCRACNKAHAKSYRDRVRKKGPRRDSPKHELHAAIEAGETWDDIGARYGISGPAVRYRAKKLGLDVDRRPRAPRRQQ